MPIRKSLSKIASRIRHLALEIAIISFFREKRRNVNLHQYSLCCFVASSEAIGEDSEEAWSLLNWG